MAENRGKQFEDVVKQTFERIPGTLVVRLHDQTTGFYGSKNPCDFLVYNKPVFMAIECKSVHGNTLPFANITEFQWDNLTKMGNVPGVVAGVLCWWIDHDVTLFLPIQFINSMKEMYPKTKSIRFDVEDITTYDGYSAIPLWGNKKRVFIDYSVDSVEYLFEEANKWIQNRKK